MAEHGGRRIGAGRKPKAERFARQIAAIEKKVADRLPLVVDALFDLAEGVQIQEEDAEGRKRTYIRPPDFRAGAYLLDRILGKPAQSVEVDAPLNDTSGPVTIREVVIERPAVSEIPCEPIQEPVAD